MGEFLQKALKRAEKKLLEDRHGRAWAFDPVEGIGPPTSGRGAPTAAATAAAKSVAADFRGGVALSMQTPCTRSTGRQFDDGSVSRDDYRCVLYERQRRPAQCSTRPVRPFSAGAVVCSSFTVGNGRVAARGPVDECNGREQMAGMALAATAAAASAGGGRGAGFLGVIGLNGDGTSAGTGGGLRPPQRSRSKTSSRVWRPSCAVRGAVQPRPATAPLHYPLRPARGVARRRGDGNCDAAAFRCPFTAGWPKPDSAGKMAKCSREVAHYAKGGVAELELDERLRTISALFGNCESARAGHDAQRHTTQANLVGGKSLSLRRLDEISRPRSAPTAVALTREAERQVGAVLGRRSSKKSLRPPPWRPPRDAEDAIESGVEDCEDGGALTCEEPSVEAHRECGEEANVEAGADDGDEGSGWEDQDNNASSRTTNRSQHLETDDNHAVRGNRVECDENIGAQGDSRQQGNASQAEGSGDAPPGMAKCAGPLTKGTASPRVDTDTGRASADWANSRRNPADKTTDEHAGGNAGSCSGVSPTSVDSIDRPKQHTGRSGQAVSAESADDVDVDDDEGIEDDIDSESYAFSEQNSDVRGQSGGNLGAQAAGTDRRRGLGGSGNHGGVDKIPNSETPGDFRRSNAASDLESDSDEDDYTNDFDQTHGTS
eukprot:TRINITY_DN31200_c0_g1_i1.p1 TRINITY_DN31200_c0_g1~~TRINITY_DN31200_c0_g1_i1.p1  ORF type:complete len:660 (+),score=98.41 TRINITY_DN31200_c0_g1_i1:175-2154(+)